MTDPAVLAPRSPPVATLATTHARQSLAPATLRAYRAGWEAFSAWRQLQGQIALPATPETVADHLASMATTHSRASLAKRLSAIGQYPWLAGHMFSTTHPVIHHTLRGIHRQHGRPSRQAAALTTAEIKRLLATCRTLGLTDVRDRALLLLGFAAALRRSGLIGINREHVSCTPEGLRLLIPRSKTDAAGQGAEIGTPRGAKPETCPVRALEVLALPHPTGSTTTFGSRAATLKSRLSGRGRRGRVDPVAA
jgi:integrase